MEATLAVVERDLRATAGRLPALEARLDQLAGDASGSWSAQGPDEAICPTAALLEIERAAAMLTLADDDAARTAARRRLEQADAMLADVAPYRRGVFAPLVLARSYAAAGARTEAVRWLDETGQRAGHCFCAETLAAATRERGALLKD